MSKTIYTKILTRSDTSTNWASSNPVLGIGEIGFDTTLGKHKIGNGVSTWNSLPYFALSQEIPDISEKVDQIDTLIQINTLAASGTIDGDLY